MNEPRNVVDGIEVNGIETYALRDDAPKAERRLAFPTVALGGSTPS